MYIDRAYMLNSIDEANLNILTGGSENKLNEKIKASDSMIDSYLRSKITALPLTDPPDSIKQISYDITIYNLHDRVQFNDIPDWVKDKYIAAIDYLNKIASGKVTLIPEISQTNVETTVLVGGDDPVMTRSFP